MSADTEKTKPLMLRVDLTHDELYALRAVALEQRVTMQRLIGDILRAALAEREAA